MSRLLEEKCRGRKLKTRCSNVFKRRKGSSYWERKGLLRVLTILFYEMSNIAKHHQQQLETSKLEAHATIVA